MIFGEKKLQENIDIVAKISVINIKLNSAY